MTAYLVLNEVSLKGGAPADDEPLIVTLTETFLALRRSVSLHDEERVMACVPENIYEVRLPSGALLLGAVQALRRRAPDIASRWRTILDRGTRFGEDGTVQPIRRPGAVLVTHATGPSPSLRAARTAGGISWSADRPGWRAPHLSVEVHDASGAVASETLVNAWCSQVARERREALAVHVSVLPDYEDPQHHDPDSPARYQRGKSHIPRAAERLLRHAISEPGGTTWWVRCEHRFYHRFQGSVRGAWVCVHWNATTNPLASDNRSSRKPTTEEDVPRELREILEARPPVPDCGCRELTG